MNRKNKNGLNNELTLELCKRNFYKYKNMTSLFDALKDLYLDKCI